MNYLLRVIKRDLAERTKDIWSTMSSDIELTEDTFTDYYGQMGKLMYRVEKYEKVSEVMKDLEAGEWAVVGLDQVCEETMTDWWKMIGREAVELYNKEN